MEKKLTLIDSFTQIIERLWANLEGIIGTSATVLIFQCALRETTPEFPFLESARVEETGFIFSPAVEDLSDIEWGTMQSGMMAFLTSSLGILTDLTGPVLADNLKNELHRFEQTEDSPGL